VRKWLLALPLCVGLALVALLVWFGVEDAGQAALLDAREQEASARLDDLKARARQVVRAGAPEDDLTQTRVLIQETRLELEAIRVEQERRRRSWDRRLLWEIRRRVGW
jgi:hypothetical protein